MGDFWWWSALLFLATRSGDLIQAFVGLWLVPHYVPQSELGAVLPLVQISGVLGLPLSILLMPLMKFANTYATNGEYGKLKTLLRFAFIGSGAAFVAMFLASKFIMPLFFERLRIPAGMLGTLILLLGLTNTIAPIFGNTLQALKKFKQVFVINMLGAPLRLVVMLATMPIRALSGYMLGQMVPGMLNVAVSLFGLRKELCRGIKPAPVFRAEWRAMLRYTWPIAINTVAGAFFGGWQALLIRQRLPEVESAAYYMISRLAEIGCYVGLALAVVMFPYAAEAQTKGASSGKLLRNLLGATALAGLAFVIFYAVFGRFILGLVPLWTPYREYAWQLVLLTAVLATRQVVGNFTSYEMAQSRFGCLLWSVPMCVIETGTLVALTGYGFFIGILPERVVSAMAALNAARLDFFLWWLFASAALQSLFMLAQIWLRRRTNTTRTSR